MGFWLAKFVFLEYLRHADQSQAAVAGLKRTQDAGGVPRESADSEALLDRLEQCLAELPATDRALILDYYQGEQGVKIEKRRALAARLGVTANALSIRACRIRDKLEACVQARAGSPGDSGNPDTNWPDSSHKG